MTVQFAGQFRLTATKATRWTLLAITWVAFLVRVVNLSTQSLWRDEVDAIRFSGWSLSELLAGLFREGHNGPLFFLLLRFGRYLTGDSEFALRYPSAWLGVVAVPLSFALARQLKLPRSVGLLLGLLLATSPYLVWYGQEAKMYTLLLALITLAVIAYLKALTGSRLLALPRWGWWIVFVAATTLSYYTHILAPLMLPVYGVIAALNYVNLRQHWRGWLISMIVLTLPYLPLALWQLPLLYRDFQSGHPFYPLREQFYLLLQLYSGGLIRFAPADLLPAALAAPGNLPGILSRLVTVLQQPTAGLSPLFLYVFLFLCSLFLRPNTGQVITLTRRITLAAWTLLPPLLVYLISLRVRVFEDRYLIYIVPAFYLLAAVGLWLVKTYARWLAGVCLALLIVVNVTGMWQQQRRPIKADFRAAAAYLSAQPIKPTVIMIQIPYLQHTFNYYYHADYKLREGLWTNDNKTEASAAAEMAALTADISDLWLVVSEEDLWDKRHLTRTWLNQNASLVDEAHFMRVDVYHYLLRPGEIETPSVK